MRTRLDEIVEEECRRCGIEPAPDGVIEDVATRCANRAFRHGVERQWEVMDIWGLEKKHSIISPPVQPAPAGEKCPTRPHGWTPECGFDHDRRKGERRKITPWTRERYGRREYWGWVDGKETGSGYDRRTGKDRRK